LIRWTKNNRESETAVLAGDLNCHYGSTEYKMLQNGNTWKTEKTGYTDSNQNLYRRRGYFRGAPESTADYIWIGGENAVIQNAETVFTDEASQISDHFGVMAEVRPLSTAG